MGLWINREDSDDGWEALSTGPSGGALKQWLAGVTVPLLVVGYAVHSILHGHVLLLGKHGSMDVAGDAAIGLSIAYIALGAFLHFHYFWGLSQRLWSYSHNLKILSLIVFLSGFGYCLYHLFAGDFK